VIACVEEIAGPADAPTVAEKLDWPGARVRYHLTEAEKAGQIQRVATGQYAPLGWAADDEEGEEDAGASQPSHPHNAHNAHNSPADLPPAHLATCKGCEDCEPVRGVRGVRDEDAEAGLPAMMRGY
jgi:hypothetical protein